MACTYGTQGKDVIACIGPSISLEAFEVGDEVYDCFERNGFEMQRIASRRNKWHIDLWEANRMQLLDLGGVTFEYRGERYLYLEGKCRFLLCTPAGNSVGTHSFRHYAGGRLALSAFLPLVGLDRFD